MCFKFKLGFQEHISLCFPEGMAAALSQLLPISSSTATTIIAGSCALGIFSSELEWGLSLWSSRSWLWEPGAEEPRGSGAGESHYRSGKRGRDSANQNGEIGGLHPFANEPSVWIVYSWDLRAVCCLLSTIALWQVHPEEVPYGWRVDLLWRGPVAVGAEINMPSTVFPKDACTSAGTHGDLSWYTQERVLF